MGLMLSVLVFCVGVLEALSCLEHIRYSYLPFELRKRKRRLLVDLRTGKARHVDAVWPSDVPYGQHVIRRRSAHESLSSSFDNEDLVSSSSNQALFTSEDQLSAILLETEEEEVEEEEVPNEEIEENIREDVDASEETSEETTSTGEVTQIYKPTPTKTIHSTATENIIHQTIKDTTGPISISDNNNSYVSNKEDICEEKAVIEEKLFLEDETGALAIQQQFESPDFNTPVQQSIKSYHISKSGTIYNDLNRLSSCNAEEKELVLQQKELIVNTKLNENNRTLVELSNKESQENVSLRLTSDSEIKTIAENVEKNKNKCEVFLERQSENVVVSTARPENSVKKTSDIKTSSENEENREIQEEIVENNHIKNGTKKTVHTQYKQDLDNIVNSSTVLKCGHESVGDAKVDLALPGENGRKLKEETDVKTEMERKLNLDFKAENGMSQMIVKESLNVKDESKGKSIEDSKRISEIRKAVDDTISDIRKSDSVAVEDAKETSCNEAVENGGNKVNLNEEQGKSKEIIEDSKRISEHGKAVDDTMSNIRKSDSVAVEDAKETSCSEAVENGGNKVNLKEEQGKSKEILEDSKRISENGKAVDDTMPNIRKSDSVPVEDAKETSCNEAVENGGNKVILKEEQISVVEESGKTSKKGKKNKSTKSVDNKMKISPGKPDNECNEKRINDVELMECVEKHGDDLEKPKRPAAVNIKHQMLKMTSSIDEESISTSGTDGHTIKLKASEPKSTAESMEKMDDPTSPDKAFWLIFSGEYTKAMSKDWHSGHFCCWQCDESLTGQRYVLRDDHPYCIKCYESVFANTCDECNKTIGIDSKDLSYKDKHWHEACFFCNKCRVSLVDKQFGSKADKIYCGNCYDAQFASRCDGCGQIFRAGTKKMEYKTRQWHEQCFCCCVCKTPIGTKSFIPREQEIYCATCYEEKFATRCVKCNKIITSGGVTYKNEPWHRECFTCTNCNISLAGQRFTSREEKPYCADCFGELFAKRCTACCKPITGIGGTRFISFEDRHWHNDCFICASCKSSLVGRGFITDAEDILCTECAKQKLM